MYIIDKNAENEIIIKKSRFITKLYYIEDVNNVNDIINDLKKEYKKCTHICYSYIPLYLKKRTVHHEQPA